MGVEVSAPAVLCAQKQLLYVDKLLIVNNNNNPDKARARVRPKALLVKSILGVLN